MDMAGYDGAWLALPGSVLRGATDGGIASAVLVRQLPDSLPACSGGGGHLGAAPGPRGVTGLHPVAPGAELAVPRIVGERFVGRGARASFPGFRSSAGCVLAAESAERADPAGRRVCPGQRPERAQARAVAALAQKFRAIAVCALFSLASIRKPARPSNCAAISATFCGSVDRRA